MRCLLLTALLVAACSKGPDADLPAIGEARSLAAEWALVNEQAAAGHVTPTYARTMRAKLREQLQTSLGSLTQPKSEYGNEVRSLLAASGAGAQVPSEPGDLWEDTVEAEMSGMPAGMAGRTQTHKRCSPRNADSVPMADQGGRCEMLDVRRSASGMAWKMR